MTAEEFRAALRSLGMARQKDAAEALGLTQSTISRYTAGLTPIPRCVEIVTFHLRGLTPPDLVIAPRVSKKAAPRPEYGAWRNMIYRCSDDSDPNYGGRGITVYPAWRASFWAFYAYVGPRPTPGHSLDRFPDNNGNYEPGNVRWATWKEQATNRRPNGGRVRVTVDGETRSLSAWARRLGIAPATISGRLRRGVPLALAVTQPKRRARLRMSRVRCGCGHRWRSHDGPCKALIEVDHRLRRCSCAGRTIES